MVESSISQPQMVAAVHGEAPITGKASLQPMRVLQVELSRPLPFIDACEPVSGRCYARAQLLVCLHGLPLGRIEIDLPAGGEPAVYAHQIWEAMEPQINAHLATDGRGPATGIEELLAGAEQPRCVREFEAFLASAPFASVVVCTRDRTDQLAAALETLLDMEYPDYEVIVVDNAPRTEATAELVQTRFAHATRLRYIREDRPGLSLARNTGLAHARGEVVAFTDDDVLAGGLWLARAAQALYSRPDAACVTGLTLPAELETDAQILYEGFGGFNKGRAYERLTFNTGDSRPADPLFPYLAGKFGAGVNMAYRTSVLRSLGGFDEALGAGMPAGGGEDIEAFFRILTTGHTLIYEPAAVLHHFHRRDYSSLEKQLHSYGVAFTAFVTRCLLDRPSRLLFLLSKIPYATRYLLYPDSPRNEHKGPEYPAALTRAEGRGMMYGPFAYWKSRRRVHTLSTAHSLPRTG